VWFAWEKYLAAMLHTLLFSQSGPKASERPPDKLSSKTSEAQLKGISSKQTTQPSTPAVELRQSEALHPPAADMPSSSKSARKKKAGKPTESTLIVPPTASAANNGGGNMEKKGHLKQEQEPSSMPQSPKSWFSLSTVWR